jgi:hypothetical protein
MISANNPQLTVRSSPYCVIWARRDYLRYLNLRRLKPRTNHNTIESVKKVPVKEGVYESR